MVQCPDTAYEKALAKFQAEIEAYRLDMEGLSRQFNEYLNEMGWDRNSDENPFYWAARSLEI